ncbi:MAG TPA: hypothetical protein VFZ33_08075 [Chitinophagaceae bacterium]
MKRLIQILESKYATVFCIIFAIANRIVFATLYSIIGRDARVQITLAKNFLAGKGLGVTKYFAADLNTPVFDTTQLFAPGVSFIIMPFLKLFNNDEYKALLALDIVICIFFVIAVRSVGKKAGLPIALNNILTLIAGCTQYTFFMSGTSSDTIGLTFILFGLSILVDIIEKPGRKKLVTLLLYGFIFFLPSFFRYMYLPVSVLFPIIIIAFGVFYKNKALRNTGTWLFVFVVSFIILMLSLSCWLNGNSLYVIDTGRGIFFDQLIHWYPYIPAAFINIDFAAQLIAKVTGINYIDAFIFFEVVNVIFFLFLVFQLLRWFLFKRIQLNKSSIFIMSGTAISLCILSLLAYFALTYKPQLYGIYLWNYNYESRYFAFIYIFLPILILLFLSFYKSFSKSFIFKCILFTAALLLFIEVLHGVYYNAKILTRHNDVMAMKDRVADYVQFPQMLKGLEAKYPEQEILISASDQSFLHNASELGYKAIFDYTSLNKIDLTVEKKSILLFPIHETDVWVMKDYLERRKPVILTRMAGTVFYFEELSP